MEMPPDRKKFKRDLYRVAAGFAIMGADIYPAMLTRNSGSFLEQVPVAAAFAFGGAIALWGAESMARENYELESQGTDTSQQTEQ